MKSVCPGCRHFHQTVYVHPRGKFPPFSVDWCRKFANKFIPLSLITDCSGFEETGSTKEEKSK